MELVPIIYQILIFVALLLFLVLAISFIISRIKKSHAIDEGLDLVGGRITELSHLDQRMPNQHYPQSVKLRAPPKPVVEKVKQNSPNIKVIRRSSTIKSAPKVTRKTRKSNYYTKSIGKAKTSTGNQRYTILNEDTSESRSNLPGGFTTDVQSFDSNEEKFANFR